MSDFNNQLQEALIEALDELYNAEDAKHAELIVQTINEIRGDMNLIMMTDKYVEKHVWEKLRKITSTMQTLMSTTTTFVCCIDDVEGAIKRFVRAAIPFTNATQIVDDETINKAAEHIELEKVLMNNLWLFFLLYASTNMRIVNKFLVSIQPVKKEGK